MKSNFYKGELILLLHMYLHSWTDI